MHVTKGETEWTGDSAAQCSISDSQPSTLAQVAKRRLLKNVNMESLSDRSTVAHRNALACAQLVISCKVNDKSKRRNMLVRVVFQEAPNLLYPKRSRKSQKSNNQSPSLQVHTRVDLPLYLLRRPQLITMNKVTLSIYQTVNGRPNTLASAGRTREVITLQYACLPFQVKYPWYGSPHLYSTL